MSVLSAPYMHDEAAAFAHVEKMLWPEGPICPKCGSVAAPYVLNGVRSKPSAKNPEGVERHGLKKCRDCHGQFTVRMGTIFEDSHIALHLWLQAIHLMASSKKGISSNQLHRTLGITLKSAWFLSHRIREAMSDDGIGTFGAGGGIVEMDETFIGREPGMEVKRAYHHKMKIVALVDRASRTAKSMVVDDLKAATLAPIMDENISREARLFTDDAKHYRRIAKRFADHQAVDHSQGEYVKGEVHTNTIEGYFSIFKRGMKGIYQHCGKNYLHHYATEFEYRYNNRVAHGVNDTGRAQGILMGVVGKRLLYRDSLCA